MELQIDIELFNIMVNWIANQPSNKIRRKRINSKKLETRNMGILVSIFQNMVNKSDDTRMSVWEKLIIPIKGEDRESSPHTLPSLGENACLNRLSSAKK